MKRAFTKNTRLSTTFTGVVVLLALIGCGYSEEEMQAKQARINDLETQLKDSQSRSEDLEARLNDVAAKNATMASRLKELGENVEQLEQERGSLKSTVEKLSEREKQAQARLATFRNMLERFKSMIASGALRVRIVRNRMVVELPEGILFDSGKAVLKKDGEATLAKVAEVLKTINDREFQITGHTDNVPIRSARFPSNWELSTARAVNVLKFLVNSGMDRQMLSAAGYAFTQPVAPNDSKESRAKNRRIEIVLMPQLNELPDLSSLEGLEK
ncbi:MAG: OmpA family protein [Myxococcales bacterium]|nr:MAG: OmpA family protein [Myxococcales bacterium]